MKENDKNMLNKIFGAVEEIGRRVEALERNSVQQQSDEISDWLRKTYPEGYITPEELAARRPDTYDCHQLMVGMVIGDQYKDKSVIHPIVPMMFHDGKLGYAYDADDKKVCFDGIRDDLPVLLGGFDHPEGMYVPFTVSERGAEIAINLIRDLRHFPFEGNEENSPKPKAFYTKGIE